MCSGKLCTYSCPSPQEGIVLNNVHICFIQAEALLALTAEIPGARAMEGNHGVGVRSDQSNLVGTVPICFADAAVGIGLYIKRCLGLIWQDTLFQECSSDTGGVGIKVAWPKDLMQVTNEA